MKQDLAKRREVGKGLKVPREESKREMKGIKKNVTGI
jgi:hypothetical protein